MIHSVSQSGSLFEAEDAATSEIAACHSLAAMSLSSVSACAKEMMTREKERSQRSRTNDPMNLEDFAFHSAGIPAAASGEAAQRLTLILAFPI